MNLMGVDLGITKIAMVMSGETPDAQGWHGNPRVSRAVQLRQLGSCAYHFALSHEIDQVWIEDTLIGNNRKYSIQLTEVKGAVMSSLAYLCDVRLVNVSTWKKQVVGDGHANKDSVRDYIHVTHPAYAPLCGSDQDLYDAACIALYGRQIMDRASDLRLVTG
jgi:Holliday junction resolvasome RuvABC endonuclease subunit